MSHAPNPSPSPHEASGAKPFIGFYVAAASFICCVLMLHDIICGFIKMQRWLPCKWFKLNSVTLMLIGVVLKVTMDLTTVMESRKDHIAKVSGTMSLCVYMCYIFPSLGDMKDRTNMYALSILVISVLGHIFMEAITEDTRTGAVMATEIFGANLIILLFMFFILVILWHFVLSVKNRYRSEISDCKSRFIAGRGSFLWLLKVCYLRSYMSNPQFVACMQMDYCTVGDLCLFLWFVFMLFCIGTFTIGNNKHSEYKWSVMLIVPIQLVTISVGTFACYYRRFTMSSHVRSSEILKRAPIDEPYMSNPIWTRKFFLVKAANYLYILIMLLSYWSVSIPVRVFDFLKSKTCHTCCSSRKLAYNRTIKAFENLGYKDYDEWILWKSVDDMEKWIKRSQTKTSNLSNLSRILTVSPRYQGPRPRDLSVSREDLRIRGRLLPLTVLVRIIQAFLPKSNNSRKIIMETFRETFKTLHFIEQHVHTLSRKDTEVAKAIWKTSGFRRLLPYSLRLKKRSSLPADYALPVIEHIHKSMGDDDVVGHEVLCIKKIVVLRTYSSVEELGYFMEDLFADLLDPLLAQLPEAIHNAVMGSPDEEFEKRVRQSLEHLCKFESWDMVDKWKLPQGCEHFPGLMKPGVPEDEFDQGDIVTAIPLNNKTTTEVPAFQV